MSAPNPYARSTTIAYALAEAGDVRLAVYDALGRQVALLVDEERGPGTCAVTFDGSALPPGTYLYRIETCGQTATGQVPGDSTHSCLPPRIQSLPITFSGGRPTGRTASLLDSPKTNGSDRPRWRLGDHW
jgi:hypothetical protein